MSLRSIGDYRITRELGRGGMGTVYQALSAEGATVAVKTVVWPDTVDPRARWNAIERFQREARAARSLSHPNICRVLDFGADENSLFIVMEFLDGDTVRQLIDLAGKIELGRAVPIVRDVGEALAHAHGKGIIHRDIKPGNIMVLRNGQVKLADFGLAFVVHETGVSRTAETMGTLFYLSPEQVRGDRVDARSDIFSLGATFCEMVTGTHAFSGESPAAVMHQILTGDPALAKDLPDSVCRLLEKCLRKDPQERFQSAREMTDCLSMWERAAAPTPTAVLPKEEPKAARSRWRRLLLLPRARKRWLALAAAAAVVVAGTALLLLRGMRPSEHVWPPSLGRLPQGYVATYLYKGAGPISGIAPAPDGTLLVTVGSANPVRPGVYVARPGDHCDSTDAYAPPGPPFQTPGGIARRADGQVLVADADANAVWAIRGPGDPPRLLTDQVPSPADVVVAPSGFEGAIVRPGDALVCVSSSASADRFGLYVVDHRTSDVRVLAGPPELQNGLVHADFGPNGKLYAVDDDSDCDGLTVLSISPNGEATTILENFRLSTVPHACTGPLAVDPATGDVLFAYRSVIYRLPAGGGKPQKYVEGDREITALEFSPDGSSLFVDGLRDNVVVKIAPRSVEGRLLVGGYCKEGEGVELGSEAFCYVMSGASDTPLPVPTGATQADLSPLGDEVAYVLENAYPGDKPWRKRSHIWKTDLRDSSRANLTEVMGVRTINCQPLWSRDGRRIAFLHCEPVPGDEPCKTGMDVWVMNAEGTNPHPVAQAKVDAGIGSVSFPKQWWSANGDRVLYKYGHEGQLMSVNADGTNAQGLEIPSGNISPDGSKIADEATVEDVVDGEPGVWRQLYLADADGTHRRVLCEQFVRDRDIADHLDKYRIDRTKPRWQDDVREWLGPRRITWSPNGHHVAFVAVLPFDPAGDHYSFQQEVWMCELSTGALTRLTENTACEDTLSWAGPIAERGGR